MPEQAPINTYEENISLMDRAREFAHERGRQAALLLMTVGLSVGALACSDDKEPVATDRGPAATAATTTAAAETSTTNPEACAPTWEMPGVDIDAEHGKWFANGIPEIQAATNETAEDAIMAWVNGTKEHPGIIHDKVLFSTAYNAVMEKSGREDRVQADQLVDADGCATQVADLARANLMLTLGQAEFRVVETIEGNAVNTGRNENGDITRSSNPRPIGNDAAGNGSRAIEIIFNNSTSGEFVNAQGEKCTYDNLYVMWRCGQLVFVVDDSNVHCIPGIPGKVDDGDLPGDVSVPADQDPGTPDEPGNGPAGQPPSPDGTIPGETLPPAPPITPRPTQPPTTVELPPATTTPPPPPEPPTPATTVVPTTVPPTSVPPKP